MKIPLVAIATLREGVRVATNMTEVFSVQNNLGVWGGGEGTLCTAKA